MTQSGNSLSGSATYTGGYVVGDCSSPSRSDLHATISEGTVTGLNTAKITSAYDHDQGTYEATLTLQPDGTLQLQEAGGDSAMFHRS